MLPVVVNNSAMADQPGDYFQMLPYKPSTVGPPPANIGGSSGAMYQGNGSPVGVLTPGDPNSPAIYTDLSNGQLWTWSVAGQAWS